MNSDYDWSNLTITAHAIVSPIGNELVNSYLIFSYLSVQNFKYDLKLKFPLTLKYYIDFKIKTLK